MNMRQTTYLAFDLDDCLTAIIKDSNGKFEEIQLIYTKDGKKQRIHLTPSRCEKLDLLLGATGIVGQAKVFNQWTTNPIT